MSRLMVSCARATRGRGRPSPGLMARLGVPVGGRVRKLRAVEDQSAPIPGEITSELGGGCWMGTEKWWLSIDLSLPKVFFVTTSGRNGSRFEVTGTRNKACGPIRSRCRRGSGGSGSNGPAGGGELSIEEAPMRKFLILTIFVLFFLPVRHGRTAHGYSSSRITPSSSYRHPFFLSLLTATMKPRRSA